MNDTPPPKDHLTSRSPPLSRQIFVNRNLRMDTVKAIGFDMDYTIARYKKVNIETLAHRLTVEKLVQRGYPEALHDLTYDPTFVIRGLTVDKKLGNVLKLDRHGHVGQAYHGRRPLSKLERRQAYRNEKLRFDSARFSLVDTYFELPEICLFADLIDLRENDPSNEAVLGDPWQLFDDIRSCIDEVHRDDSLKAIIKSDLPHYIEDDPQLAQALHKLRSAGKKLFLLTNSFGAYSAKVMSYILDDVLPEYPSWQNYFDLVIVGSGKPGFFTQQEEPITQLDNDFRPILRGVKKIEKGCLYQGGNAKALEKLLRCTGEEILYVGDHIYGDILRSKRNAFWRTALVVEELEEELALSIQTKDALEQLYHLEARRRELDDLCNYHRQELSLYQKQIKGQKTVSARTQQEGTELKRKRTEAKQELKRVLKSLETLTASIDDKFNPFWGMVFKLDQENTKFGEQVARHACLYTSRVSNFLYYSNFQYFRSPRDLLPHEEGYRRTSSSPHKT